MRSAGRHASSWAGPHLPCGPPRRRPGSMRCPNGPSASRRGSPAWMRSGAGMACERRILSVQRPRRAPVGCVMFGRQAADTLDGGTPRAFACGQIPRVQRAPPLLVSVDVISVQRPWSTSHVSRFAGSYRPSRCDSPRKMARSLSVRVGSDRPWNCSDRFSSVSGRVRRCGSRTSGAMISASDPSASGRQWWTAADSLLHR